jgi:hypothetical protein
MCWRTTARWPCPAAFKIPTAKVKSGVGHAQKTPLKGLRFESLDEAQAYLDHWEQRWAEVRKLDAEWNLGRFQSEKLEAIFDASPADQLLFRMHQAAEFSSDLSRNDDRLDRFTKLLVTGAP